MNATTNELNCRVKSCGHAPFTGKHAQRAELMHYHRVHSGSILVPKQGNAKRKRKASTVTARFNLRNGDLTEGFSEIPLRKNGQPDRRSSAWKQQKAQNKQAKKQKKQFKVQEVPMHFCPNCLTDLTKVAMGLVRSKQLHLHVNGCPRCGCDLKAIAQELAAN